MNKYLGLVFALAVALSGAAYAQQHGGHAQHGARPQQRANPPRGNGGRIPPAPEARKDQHVDREAERDQGGHVNEVPHVRNDHWYGHDAPGDQRFHLDHPFEHGHFEHFGPSYRYRVLRFDPDRHRFWLPGGFFFEIADWDWHEAADWCWTCGDDFVVYEDPDHPGWYLVYNVHTGVYVHAQYMGS
jgi:hypothetical protein